MNEQEIVAKLNWFYTLEMNQVDLYTAQARAMENVDIYLAKTFARVASIEQQHVDNLASEIKKRGARPTRLGDIISPLLGKTAGTVTGMAGPILVLKANIALEEKAMQDYKNMIIHVSSDWHLFDILWDNLIDEDLHTAWFANKLAELEQN
jgi:bacterioferritin